MIKNKKRLFGYLTKLLNKQLYKTPLTAEEQAIIDLYNSDIRLQLDYDLYLGA